MTGVVEGDGLAARAVVGQVLGLNLVEEALGLGAATLPCMRPSHDSNAGRLLSSSASQARLPVRRYSATNPF